MTRNLSTEQQLRLAKIIIASNLETAKRLNALVASKITNNYEAIAPQHIKQDVEALCGDYTTLTDIFDGAVEIGATKPT